MSDIIDQRKKCKRPIKTNVDDSGLKCVQHEGRYESSKLNIGLHPGAIYIVRRTSFDQRKKQRPCCTTPFLKSSEQL